MQKQFDTVSEINQPNLLLIFLELKTKEHFLISLPLEENNQLK